jgi:hypothetical protein
MMRFPGPIVSCPKCRTEIPITESLAAPLIEATRQRYEEQIARTNEEIAAREAAVQTQQSRIRAEKAALEEQIAKRLREERERIASEEAQKARMLLADELELKKRSIAELQAVLKERESKLANAQKAQAELLRKERELEDARREMALTVERKVSESVAAIREKAKEEAENASRLKIAEREEQIAGMTRHIAELKRRAEQGSQQLQGEVLELQLESLLRQKFPHDLIEPVAKGEFGGDALQRVIGPSGKTCGTILWETKRTKNWSDSWLPKLRADMRAAKAEVALIVSQTLPKGMELFDLIDGVWVAEPKCAIPVALSLRQGLIDVAAARQSQQGQLTKMELVYAYLTGPTFRHRVEAIVEKFSDMRDDLDRERKTMTRLWAKREAQIQGVLEATVGMYGDLQGIAGKALPEIAALELPLLDSCEMSPRKQESSKDQSNDRRVRYM